MLRGNRLRQVKRFKLRYRRGQRYFNKELRFHPYFLPIVGFFTIIIISLFLFVILKPTTTNASDAHNIVFFHDNIREEVPTRATSVGEFLSRRRDEG